MYHEEGGWPKEVNYQDVEVTQRYRRRVEKDDIWAPSMKRLLSVSLQWLFKKIIILFLDYL